MSLLTFLFKSKKKMLKKPTKVVRIKKYIITSHAQNRLVEKERALKKRYVVSNLYTKPLGLSGVKIDDLKRPSYRRVGKWCTAYVNPTNNHVTSLRRPDSNDIREFQLKRKGKRYVKKSKR